MTQVRRQIKMDGDLIKLHSCTGKIYVWNAADVNTLRKTHHILGSLVGSLPNTPRQNTQLGLPLQLMPEETAVLLQHGVAKLVTVSVSKPTSSQVDEFKQRRMESIRDQKLIWQQYRAEQKEQLKELIEEGRRKKMEMKNKKKELLQAKKLQSELTTKQDKIKEDEKTSVGVKDDCTTGDGKMECATRGQLEDRIDEGSRHREEKGETLADDGRMINKCEGDNRKEMKNEKYMYCKGDTTDKDNDEIQEVERAEGLNDEKGRWKAENQYKDQIHEKDDMQREEKLKERLCDDGDKQGERINEWTDENDQKEERLHVMQHGDAEDCELRGDGDTRKGCEIHIQQVQDTNRLSCKQEKSDTNDIKDDNQSTTFADPILSTEKPQHVTMESGDFKTSDMYEKLPADTDELDVKCQRVKKKDRCEKMEVDIKESGCSVQLFTSEPAGSNLVLDAPTWVWNFPTTQEENLRCRVFHHFWQMGYYLTSGAKFGGDFLVYPGDPLLFHSYFIAVCILYNKKMSPLDLVCHGRLGTFVKKTIVLCSLDDNKQVVCTSIQWSGMS